MLSFVPGSAGEPDQPENLGSSVPTRTAEPNFLKRKLLGAHESFLGLKVKTE
jgi:hypothetical protein